MCSDFKDAIRWTFANIDTQMTKPFIKKHNILIMPKVYSYPLSIIPIHYRQPLLQIVKMLTVNKIKKWSFGCLFLGVLGELSIMEHKQ